MKNYFISRCLKTVCYLIALSAFTTSSFSATAQHNSISCTGAGKAPIIKSGDFFTGATWNDPSVIYENNQFIMYASSDHNFDGKIEIYRLLSKDGTNWTLNPPTPVLSPTKNAWDSKSVETPSVVKFKGTYYLFYTGYKNKQSDIRNYKIGYATSKDGITWEKRSNPIVAPTKPRALFPNMDFNQYLVAEPAAVVFKNRLYLYFAALGADKEVNTTLQTIGLIETRNGRDWSAPKMALRPDQSIFPRSKNYKGFSTPSATVIDNRVHMFVDIVTDDPFSQVALYHTWSEDGKENWNNDPIPLFTQEDFPWTSNQIRSPNALMLNNSIHLWFAGDSGVQLLGIGHALCAKTTP